jgi:hypothetical protein
VPSAAAPALNWIASYPRSGNKVTRVLLANYLVDGPATNADLGRVAPEISSLAARGGLLPRSGSGPAALPGTFLSPDAPLLRRYAEATSRIVYLVRNPRDLVPSAVRHLDVSVDKQAEFARRYLTRGGVSDLVPGLWGPWEQHVKAWTDPASLHAVFPRAEVLTVRFEDLKAETVCTLRGIVEFLGLDDPEDPQRVERVLENLAPERMHAAAEKERQATVMPLVRRPAPPPEGSAVRRRARTLAELGPEVEAAYRELVERNEEFAACVRRFEYDV